MVLRGQLIAVAAAALALGAAAVALADRDDRGAAARASPAEHCSRTAPLRIPADSWSPARRELAPPGASKIVLCRYSGLNAHPPLALTRSVVLTAPRLVRDLVRKFDALPAQTGTVACPVDEGSQIVARLGYRDGHVVRIAVGLTGCETVTNGSSYRTAARIGTPPTLGPRLIAQLLRLTARDAPVQAGSQALRPPEPRVSTLGVTRSASLFSYCWTEVTPGGGGRGACGDGAPGKPSHTLRWRAGATVSFDLRLPAHDVQSQAVRITGGYGGRQSKVVRLALHRSDPAGRHWTTRLPGRAAPDTDLVVSASFANGDLGADIGLTR
jgi:hypothetical protein